MGRAPAGHAHRLVGLGRHAHHADVLLALVFLKKWNQMARLLDREDLAELATLLQVLRELREAQQSGALLIPPDALILLKERVGTILGKLKNKK